MAVSRAEFKLENAVKALDELQSYYGDCIEDVMTLNGSSAYIKRLSERYDLRVKENSDKEIGVPLRLFFLDINAAIEITEKDARKGPDRKWENAKNWLCKNTGILMIRILAPGVPEFQNCLCIKRKNNSLKEAVEAVKGVMRILAGL